MSQFVRDDDEAIEQLYRRASIFVENNLRTGSNVNMHLAALVPHCKTTYTHLCCPLVDASSFTLSFDVISKLNAEFPGFTTHDERNPETGEWQKLLEFPILHKKSDVRGGGGGKRHYSPASSSGTPTIEYPVMLLLLECVIGGILYFRYTTGVAW